MRIEIRNNSLIEMAGLGPQCRAVRLPLSSYVETEREIERRMDKERERQREREREREDN